ncbi:bifunctional metallophosphatase/5'-nucleotidase [Blastococcus jejuensis]|uniref:Bifunctional metallophosphatase/5'-nucleotidase n=1 Tax=Blastococcus jejuensis TaxID=351224 RepID=A0ABP6P3U6_9ACTN
MTSLPARRAFAAGLGIAALTATLIAGASPAGAAPKKPHPHAPAVPLQLLAINDFHGQLEPSSPTSSSSGLPGYAAPRDGGPAFGGAAYLATQIKQLEGQSQEPNTLTVAAGDLIGASPLLSAAYHDEPAIEALNLMGLDYASVGNHEFDEGPEELLRMQNGGCLEGELELESCPDHTFQGADWDYLSANAFYEDSGETLLPPYAVHEVQGIKVGFIGMTLEGTPGVVTPSGVAGLDFADEAETANRYARELQQQGVEAIVVLMHEGGVQTSATDVDGCNQLTGPVTGIVPQMSRAIDVVITGHTHQAYNCREVNGRFVPSSSTTKGRLVTSGASIGRLVTDIDLQLDPRTGDVRSAVADNVPVVRTVTPDADQTELIALYKKLVDPIANQPVGTVGGAISSSQETLFGTQRGESPMGNLIADGQLAATSGDAVAALMNPGGVRGGLDTGQVTYGEAFTVQPFGNYLSTITLTGAQLQCVLEQQFVLGTVLQPSSTLRYTVDPAGALGSSADPCTGSRVVDSTVKIGGTAVVPTTEYRITVNNFLADGGDSFSTLLAGTERVNVVDPEDDLAALIQYIAANPGIVAPPLDRISVVGQP